MQRKEVVGLEGTAMDLWDRLLMMIPDGAMAMAERSSLSQMHRFMKQGQRREDRINFRECCKRKKGC